MDPGSAVRPQEQSVRRRIALDSTRLRVPGKGPSFMARLARLAQFAVRYGPPLMSASLPRNWLRPVAQLDVAKR